MGKNQASKQGSRKRLQINSAYFSQAELQQIIDDKFFDDSNPMDAGQVDVASRRMAQLRGVSAEEQCKETAYAALRRILGIQKKKKLSAIPMISDRQADIIEWQTLAATLAEAIALPCCTI